MGRPTASCLNLVFVQHVPVVRLTGIEVLNQSRLQYTGRWRSLVMRIAVLQCEMQQDWDWVDLSMTGNWITHSSEKMSNNILCICECVQILSFGVKSLLLAQNPTSCLHGFGEGFSRHVHPLLLGKYDVEGSEIVQ